jgi:hypothetical protein
MRDVLDACIAVTGSDAELRWTPPPPILDAGIKPWTDLPIWLPPGEMHDALHGSDVSKALDAGLRCRPVAETVADTWAWLHRIDGRQPQRPDRDVLGLDPDVESRVMDADGGSSA